MDYQTKYVNVRKLGWRTVVRQRKRFGWELYDAEQETTTTTETTYEGTVSGDTVYIKPKTTTSTKTRVHLTFIRYPKQFKNLAVVRPIEWIYNLVFLLRRILGSLLYLATAAVFLAFFFLNTYMASKEAEPIIIGFMAAWFVWMGLILCEVVFSLIGKAILRRKQ